MIDPGVVTVLPAYAKLGRIEEPILIGKDILELLTGAMYTDPLCVYREYIQNSCDAIDEARQIRLYKKSVPPIVDISINLTDRSVKIRDTGIGVPYRNFVRTLTAIGGSKKRGAKLRGFRGVGRLAGLGYCQELIFRSRSAEDSKVSELVWSGRRLKELIHSTDQSISLTDAIREVAEVRTLETSGYPERFFEVELRKVTRVKNDVLLNEEEVRAYLSQVAPVSFHPEFKFLEPIESLLCAHGAGQTYAIFLNDGRGQIYRPFQNTLPISDRVSDRFSDLRSITLSGFDGGIGAVGWILDHSYLGAIPRRTMISGLRFRAGNLQVGSSDQLAPYFPEPRFNSWCVGELHILDSKIIPNGRRDDFEASQHYQHLLGQVAPILKELAKTCRDRSATRNKMKKASVSLANARVALSLLKKSGWPAYLAKFVQQRVEMALQEAEKLSGIASLPAGDRKSLIKNAKELQGNFKRALNRSSHQVLFKGLNRVKREAYEEILSFIYHLSENITEAHRLAGKIVRALATNKKKQ